MDNIFEFYKVLEQVVFTTRKTKLDIQYMKLHMRVASEVAKQPKNKI